MLKVLGIGAGRDGTKSLHEFLAASYSANVGPVMCGHETDAAALYQAAIAGIRSGNFDDARILVTSWDHDVEVGNGFSFLLPYLYDWLPETKFIFLQRRDRAAHIRSLGYIYDNWPQRPTAVDFGEMTDAEWGALSPEGRTEFYVEKTYSMQNRHRQIGKNILIVNTEDLSFNETRNNIIHFINQEWKIIPRTIRKNLNPLTFFPACKSKSDLSKRQFAKFCAFYSPMNFERFFEDTSYAVETAADWFCKENISDLSIIEKKMSDIFNHAHTLTNSIEKLRIVNPNIRQKLESQMTWFSYGINGDVEEFTFSEVDACSLSKEAREFIANSDDLHALSCYNTLIFGNAVCGAPGLLCLNRAQILQRLGYWFAALLDYDRAAYLNRDFEGHPERIRLSTQLDKLLTTSEANDSFYSSPLRWLRDIVKRIRK